MNEKPETSISYNALKDQNEKIAAFLDQRQAEMESIQEVKAIANQVGALIDKLMGNPDTDKRLVALAKTNLQQGFMWAVRSIAKPDGF